MINIVIATLQPIFRTGLARVIAIEDDLRIVAQPPSVPHLHKVIDTLRPHIVLLSSDFFPIMDDLAGVISLAAARNSRIVVLTERTERTAEFVALGAEGALPREIGGKTLVNGIRRIARGEMNLQVEADADSPIGTDPVGRRAASKLSQREINIVAAMLLGYKQAEIAVQLGITVPLVKKHIHAIYDKTGVWGRLELALFVLHHQVLALARPGNCPTALDLQSRAVERMFGPCAKSARRPAIDSNSRGTSFGTTGSAPGCGKKVDVES